MRVKKAAERSPDARYEELAAMVEARSGLVFAPNRRVEAEAGIRRAMKQASTADLGAYLTLIRRDPEALDDLVDELTVGETHFLRDPDQMDLIRREVLPALQMRKGAGPPARVWSAGCASGEEAYTLAILLEEAGLDQDALVLGTDLSALALAKARTASYSEWSMRGVSSAFAESYFRKVRGRRILVDRLRSKVRFERLNLVGDEPYASVGASGMDLILCRNVLIYFDHDTAGRIAARLFECLAEGGVLLTAGADLLLGEFAPFEVEVTRVGLVYRRPRSPSLAAPMPVVRTRTSAWRPADVPAPADVAAPAAAIPSGDEPAHAAPPPHADLGREAFERVLAHANEKGAEDAQRVAAAALRRHPLDAHLHYVHAALLLSLDRDEDAEEEAERALFLDRSLAIAHFLLGTILRKRGARSDAARAFRNARDLCAARAPEEAVPAGAGERMGALHAAAAAEMERLEMSVA
jgi:chemotaxis protein methyltransferase CheR